MPTTVSETPLFFTASDRPLYAVFHPATRERAGAPVLVHCHALGVEQVTTIRTAESPNRK